MNFTDKELEQAAKQVCLSLAACDFPEPDEQDDVFSPEFEQKMARLLKKERRFTMLKKISRSAAAILLTLLTLGGVFLTFDLEARAAVRSWFRTVSGQRYTYHFNEDRRDGELPRYEIGALPEGYVLYAANYYEDNHALWYRKYNPATGKIIPLILGYFQISENSSTMLLEGSSHKLTVKTVEVNGITADLYEEIPKWNGWTTRTLIWVDEEAGIFFRLQGRLTEEHLIALAESVRRAD